VKDVIHALHGATAGLEPRHAAADEPDAVAHLAQVLTTPGGEIVEDDHVRAIADESLDQMRANEAGAASDEIAHAER